MLTGRKSGQSAETEALAGKSVGREEERENPDLAKAPSADECLPSTAPCQYAYLDHTADVQLHAWGQSLGEALEQLTIALYGYMTTEIERVEPIYTMDFSASGHDLSALVYNMLDNCLYSFSAEPFFIGRVAKVLNLKKPAGNTGEELSAHMRIWGESFDLQKHPPGTEIKAITYSNMQIIRKDGVEEGGRKKATGGEAVGWHGRTDIFVIVDI
ncbi:Protein archease [Globodera pallida]|nr:Protein archease [Globodera pallida]